MRYEGQEKTSRIRWTRVLIWLISIVVITAAVTLLLSFVHEDDTAVNALLEEPVTIRIETEAETEKPKNPVPCPEIDEQLLTINEYSRPGNKTKAIEYVVIHYLGNPKTSAQENRDYFESLKYLKNNSMSANFVIGVDGEIIECVPPGEIAYASNDMNDRSISIENCHLDDSGRFTEKTYDACVKLTAHLVAEYGLKREDIIRHYDVTGKLCPRYYVENEDKWEAFRDDVMNYIAECEAGAK